ncbi:hypothetical protein TNCV_1805711 [Trichonephila clavipes]|nr:hypothetical protein TNCV_1805711 [Trichonephila clavipes]
MGGFSGWQLTSLPFPSPASRCFQQQAEIYCSYLWVPEHRQSSFEVPLHKELESSSDSSVLCLDAGCHWEMEREAFLHPISRLLLSPCVGGPA